MKDLKIYMLVIWALLAMSCQKEMAGDDEQVCLRVSLSTEDISRVGGNALPTRYVMEVYENGNTQECLSHQEFDHSTFDVSLPRGTFDLYFWADYGIVDDAYSGRYNVESLTNVSLNEVQGDGDCFAGVQKGVNLYEGGASLAVTLRRPVACIRYVDKDGGTLPEGETLSARYSLLWTIYNVVTGEMSGEKEVTRSLTPMLEGDYFAADYVFVSGEDEVLNITVTVGEKQKEMTGITVKTNMVTKIQGNFY